MRPDWDQAPPEATHCGVDHEGMWVWFRNEPVFTLGSWWEHFGGHMPTGYYYEECDGPMHKAMERRP